MKMKITLPLVVRMAVVLLFLIGGVAGGVQALEQSHVELEEAAFLLGAGVAAGVIFFLLTYAYIRIGARFGQAFQRVCWRTSPLLTSEPSTQISFLATAVLAFSIGFLIASLLGGNNLVALMTLCTGVTSCIGILVAVYAVTRRVTANNDETLQDVAQSQKRQSNCLIDAKCRLALRPIGMLLFGIGCLGIVFGVSLAVHIKLFLRHAEVTTATVIREHIHEDGLVSPVLRYYDEINQSQHEVVYGRRSRPPRWHVHDVVSVAYDPEHPDRCIIISPVEMWLLPSLQVGGGLLILVIGLILLRRKREATASP